MFQQEKPKEKEIYKLSSADINQIRIPAGSRQVLVRIDQRNVDERTPSGIYKITDTDWQPAAHSDRTGTILAVPRGPLPFTQKIGVDLMPWETSVEIAPGMKVWFDFLASENVITYIDENGIYHKLLNYDDLYVAVYKNRIIPLNGFHLFERVYHEKLSDFDHLSGGKINTREGIVKYVAQNNRRYATVGEVDHVVLQVGDRVRFSPVPPVYLEDEAHCSFDGGTMYRRAQARNVDMVWRDGNLILPEGRLLLEQIPERDHYDLRSHLILPVAYKDKRTDIKTHRGTVLVSSIPEAEVGSEVLYIRGAGSLIDYQDKQARVLKSSEVLYVE